MSQITGTLIKRKLVNNHIYCVVQTEVDGEQKNHIVYFDVRNTQQAIAVSQYALMSTISVNGRIVYKTMKDPRFKRGKVSLFEAQEIVVKKPKPIVVPFFKNVASFCLLLVFASIQYN